MQWLMLQQDEPNDYVIATGRQYSVRDFVSMVAEELGLSIEFSGEGPDEIGIVSEIHNEAITAVKVGDIVVRVDKRYFRPTEVETLLGDPSLAKAQLGWEPKTDIRQLCKEMTEHDLIEAKKELVIKNSGL